MPDAKARQMWMQDLRSLNFEPLRAVFPELANMAGYAEHYAHTDPASSLVKLRNFAERAVDHIYTRLKLPRAPQSNFVDLLCSRRFKSEPPRRPNIEPGVEADFEIVGCG